MHIYILYSAFLVDSNPSTVSFDLEERPHRKSVCWVKSVKEVCWVKKKEEWWREGWECESGDGYESNQ